MFITNLSRITQNWFLPLKQLTQRNQPFIWNSGANEAFKSLKCAFTCAPIMIHRDQDKPCILDADASNFALGSVLSQPKYNG